MVISVARARDDFPHGRHVELVLVAPGILFEKDEVIRPNLIRQQAGRQLQEVDFT
jgi:hypothetical protein